MKKLFIALATLVAFSATASFAATEAVKASVIAVVATDAKTPAAVKVAKVEKSILPTPSITLSKLLNKL